MPRQQNPIWYRPNDRPNDTNILPKYRQYMPEYRQYMPEYRQYIGIKMLMPVNKIQSGVGLMTLIYYYLNKDNIRFKIDNILPKFRHYMPKYRQCMPKYRQYMPQNRQYISP